MTLEQFWSILLKQWRLVLFSFLVVGLGAFIGSKLMKPVYQSSVLVQVVLRSNSNQADYNALLASNNLVQTEATLATSDSVFRRVVPHYPGLTTSQLAGEVSASPKLNTQLFEIDVVDPSSTRAASLANDVAAALIQLQQEQIQQSNALARQQIQDNIDETSEQINETTTKISTLQTRGGDQGQLALLQTQLNGLQQRFTQWQAALAQLELTQAQSGNPLQIAQAAQPTTTPVRPNILLNTAGGFLAGLLLGLLLALLYEKLDTRIRTPEAIAQLLGWSVLATIWRAKVDSPQEMINPASQDANVEAYRILRTNIGFSSIDKSLQSLLITSPSSGDGKSCIAANLAIFMAKAGKSTLLIDADWHRPTQHLLFGLSSGKLGLSDAVMALSMPEESRASLSYQFFTQPSSTRTPGVPTATGLLLEPFVYSVAGVPNLWVMPSGPVPGPLPPNPAELLESKVMQSFLRLITNSGFEMVIFDAPPLLGLSDVSILAPKVEGVLVVVDTMRATKSRLRQTRARLSQTGAQVLGCVANKVQPKRHGDAYSSCYLHGHSGGEKSTRNGHVTPDTITQKLVKLSSPKQK
jgi:Mrp family chromosome partitioning ATPase/capsular polysaccharide biosynthesis protein